MYIIQVHPEADSGDEQIYEVEAFKADEQASVEPAQEGDEREIHADLTWLSSSTGILHAALANVSESIHVDHMTTKEADATGQVQQDEAGTEEGTPKESEEVPSGEATDGEETA